MDNSLRILLVTPDYPPPPGGIQTIVRNLERGLRDAGHHVKVLEIDPETYHPSIVDLVPRPRWIHSLSAVSHAEFPYLNAVYRRSTDVIQDFQPDLVHAMHVRMWPAMFASHESDIPTALSTYALEIGEKSLAREAISEADIVHAISEFTGSLVRDCTDSSVDIHVVPPSIDTETYASARKPVTSNGLGPVVTLARFVDRKNLETVIEAWSRIPDSVTESRSLVVAGDGPNRDRLERLAEDMNNVEFPGWVNGREKRELLARADAFAMVPRRNGYDVEGFGIVYIEAQAAGTPVVGSRHGGAPEAIDGGGIVVDDENDIAEVADALNRLLTSTDINQSYVSTAQERIDEFSISSVTNAHMGLYRSLLNG